MHVIWYFKYQILSQTCIRQRSTKICSV